VSGENQELSTLGIKKIINPYFCVFRQDQQDLHDFFLSFQMKLRKTNPPLAEMIRRLCANTCPACPAVPSSIPKDSAAYLTRVGPADRTGVEFCSAAPYQGIPLGAVLSELEGANTTK
jgi:hypothetical protein